MMHCVNCLRKMLFMYNSWYGAWVWKCDGCKLVQAPSPSCHQLQLFEEE